ncbi:MAG: glycosyltransferase family 2 protein [Acidimicrobiales bacterium]
MTDVRVGIVSWNTAELLDRCLTAVPAALGDLDAEVVVVDNASSDASAGVARSRPWVKAIANDENIGYARAMNQALAGTDAPFLVALNPDTEPSPGSLATLVELLRSQPDTALLVPRLAYPDGSLQHSVYRFPTVAVAAAVGLAPRFVQRRGLGRRMWLEGFAPHDEPGEIEWAIGAVHVLRAEAVRDEAVYTERWFMYVEDMELCWRLRSAGWKVRFEPDVEVRHVGNASGEQAWGGERERRYWVATYDFVRASRGALRARALAAVNVLGCLVQGGVTALRGLVPGPKQPERRRLARRLLRSIPVHVAAVLGSS